MQMGVRVFNVRRKRSWFVALELLAPRLESTTSQRCATQRCDDAKEAIAVICLDDLVRLDGDDDDASRGEGRSPCDHHCDGELHPFLPVAVSSRIGRSVWPQTRQQGKGGRGCVVTSRWLWIEDWEGDRQLMNERTGRPLLFVRVFGRPIPLSSQGLGRGKG